jgi:hypothetical protein
VDFLNIIWAAVEVAELVLEQWVSPQVVEEEFPLNQRKSEQKTSSCWVKTGKLFSFLSLSLSPPIRIFLFLANFCLE